MEILSKKLAAYKQANLYRQRRVITHRENVQVKTNSQSYTMFCNNDYLGLSAHPKVKKAFKDGVDQYGVGSTASALIAGHTTAQYELEAAFAEFLNRDRALFFSSGYMANLGVIQALLDRKDAVFADKLIHASLIDACHLSGAKMFRHKHNDLDHLCAQIRQSTSKQKLIATNSVFSMDGDLTDLPKLVEVANSAQAMLLVDDAHGIGILGKTGAGALEHYGLTQQQVPILVCPLGKAFGSMGGIVAGCDDLIEVLIQFARTYVYSTAIPPALACAGLAALNIVQTETWRREKLVSLIQHFVREAAIRKLPVSPSTSPIQSVILGDVQTTLNVSNHLLERGFFVTAIRPPTVPANTSRLRITLSCLHTESQVTDLLDILAEQM